MASAPAEETAVAPVAKAARIESLEGYMQREAILGRDPRAGAMAMLFAAELMR